MAARDLLARVLEAGGVVVNDAPGGPQLLVPKEFRPLVEAHRAELHELLTAPAVGAAAVEPPTTEPAMPSLTCRALTTFAREGCAVGIKTTWCPTLIWWAPNAIEARKLIAWGVASPGAVWIPSEIESLIGLAGPDARAVAIAKLVTDGTVIESRPR